MKRTDLEKLKGLKISEKMKGAPTPNRFGRGAGGNAQASTANPLLAKLLGRGATTPATDDASGEPDKTV